MNQKEIIKEAKYLLEKWHERKTWGDDYTGPHTTPEEDELAMILETLIIKLKK